MDFVLHKGWDAQADHGFNWSTLLQLIAKAGFAPRNYKACMSIVVSSSSSSRYADAMQSQNLRANGHSAQDIYTLKKTYARQFIAGHSHRPHLPLPLVQPFAAPSFPW